MFQTLLFPRQSPSLPNKRSLYLLRTGSIASKQEDPSSPYKRNACACRHTVSSTITGTTVCTRQPMAHLLPQPQQLEVPRRMRLQLRRRRAGRPLLLELAWTSCSGQRSVGKGSYKHGRTMEVFCILPDCLHMCP